MACRASFFLIGSSTRAAQKDVARERERGKKEGRKENVTCFSLAEEEEEEKKRRQRREKDFLYIILTFSRSCRFLSFFLSLARALSLSLFLFLRSTRKNRLIVSFYKFPCLSSLVRRAKSRRRARVCILLTRQSPIGTHGLSVGIKQQPTNMTCSPAYNIFQKNFLRQDFPSLSNDDPINFLNHLKIIGLINDRKLRSSRSNFKEKEKFPRVKSNRYRWFIIYLFYFISLLVNFRLK